MLRTYKSITHPIFRLHTQLEHLVCQVWCNADNDTPCSDLLSIDFETFYYNIARKDDWLKRSIDTIYERCKSLTAEQRADIREAFNINNRIKELCEGTISPIYLNQLPQVVEDLMKPLLARFYKELLSAIDKLDYYNKLIEWNGFKTCPCCSLTPIESAESHYREDNDHYLSKADFPFAAVNFNNLVPVCSKCNKKCKGTKNPFETGRVSFYPFDENQLDIIVSITLRNNDDIDYRKLKVNDIEIHFTANTNKIITWDWLFNIKERYNKEIRNFSHKELRTIANRLVRNHRRKHGLSYEEIINDLIEDYEIEIYEDRSFLKIPFLKEIKTKPDWMAVYA